MPFPRVIPPVVDPLIDVQVVGGVIQDVSPFARAIMTNNGVTTTTDVDLGECMVFSGAGGTYLQFAAFPIGPNYEYEIWFKPTTIHNSYDGMANFLSVVSPHSAATTSTGHQQYGSAIRYVSSSTGRLEHFNYVDGIEGAEGPLLSTNTAYHAKVRVDGVLLTMWLDDVEVASEILPSTSRLEATTGQNANSDIRLTIGSDWDWAASDGGPFDEFFTGRISRFVLRRFSPGDPP